MNSIKKYALVTTSYLLLLLIVITLDVVYLKSKGSAQTELNFDNDTIILLTASIGGGLLMFITTFWLNRHTKVKKLCRSAVYKLHLGILIISLLSLIIGVQASNNITASSADLMQNIAHSISDGNTPLRFITFGFVWSSIMSLILIINAVRSKQVKYILYSLLFLPILGFIYFLIEV